MFLDFCAGKRHQNIADARVEAVKITPQIAIARVETSKVDPRIGLSPKHGNTEYFLFSGFTRVGVEI